MAEKETPSGAYLSAEAQRVALADKLFELIVKDAWFDALKASLREHIGRNRYRYFSEPKLGLYSRYYLGGSAIYFDARRHKEDALGRKPISDDQLKHYIEEVLRTELRKYDIVLRWCRLRNLDGPDRVLLMYHKSEDIPRDS